MIIMFLLAVAVLVIVAFALFIAKQPDQFEITRTVTIATPPSVPFARVNDFHKWLDWSPWEGLDPNMKRAYEGPREGVGTRYVWDGSGQVGSGIMTTTESREPGLIRIDLEFLRPFKATNVTEFTFTPQGNQTVVSWSMTGRETFFTKAFAMVFNRDKMVGCMFQKGLDKLKAVCESAA